LAAILDFSVNNDFTDLDKCIIEFSDPKNLFKDAKIPIIAALEADI